MEGIEFHKACIECSKAIEELNIELNRLTESTPKEDLVKMFMDNSMSDLIDGCHYYLDREMYNTLDALVKAFDLKFENKINKILDNE